LCEILDGRNDDPAVGLSHISSAVFFSHRLIGSYTSPCLQLRVAMNSVVVVVRLC
jgi:hypothetical protein